MRAAGKPTDIKIYDGAGHAFQNPNNKQGFRPEAAADAAQRISAFFQKYLH
jgi:carboxymethylenebutenolidase